VEQGSTAALLANQNLRSEKTANKKQGETVGRLARLSYTIAFHRTSYDKNNFCFENYCMFIYRFYNLARAAGVSVSQYQQ